MDIEGFLKDYHTVVPFSQDCSEFSLSLLPVCPSKRINLAVDITPASVALPQSGNEGHG